MITAKIDPIGKDLAVILNEMLSRDARTKVVADFARGELTQAQETNRRALGVVPPHETFVDRRENAPLESVNPDGGIIVFEFELIQEMFAWIEDMLIMNSPHLTGRYARSHVFLADGSEASTERPPPAREYVFINTVPYARKIETGLSSQAPDGVYQGVAFLARKRFGNLAKVRFSYRSALLDYVGLGGRRGGKSASAAKRSAHNIETETRQPAIVITVG